MRKNKTERLITIILLFFAFVITILILNGCGDCAHNNVKGLEGVVVSLRPHKTKDCCIAEVRFKYDGFAPYSQKTMKFGETQQFEVPCHWYIGDTLKLDKPFR